jgi:type IV secretion system protein VirB10
MRRERGPSHAVPPVVGERSIPIIARSLSRQARLSNLLATALIASVGAALLVWYYAHSFQRPGRPEPAARAQGSVQAGHDFTLPPLGALSTRAPHSGMQSPDPAPAVPPALPTATPASFADPPLPPVPVAAGSAVSRQAADPAQASLQRRLGGQAFVAASGPPPVPPATGAPVPLTAQAPAVLRPPPDDDAVAPRAAPIQLSWHGGDSAGSGPYVLSNQSLVLPKGSFIDCTLQTAIDSTLPGMTSCVTATDTFGADGRVVLLERGTQLVGETEGQVQQGSARVFVMWNQARTPLGVIVPLESPGADELGRAGLPGSVRRHFWERFGAAIMISMIDGAVQAAVQSSAQNGGTVIYQPGGSQDVMTEVLKSTVNIPPTVIKRNGDRIQILVARDVDFHQVYELQHAAR